MTNLYKQTQVIPQQLSLYSRSPYKFSRFASAAMAGLGAALILGAISTIAEFLPERSIKNDFAFAYISGRILRQGGNPYTTNLMKYNSTEKLPFRANMGPATNPPLLLWSYQVLPLFRPATAFALWVTIEVLSVLVILLTSSRLVNTHWSCAGWLLAIGLTLYSTPMFHHFWYSQVQLPIVALLMTGFWLWRRGRATGACSFFVLGGVLKLYGLTCAPFPILAASARTRFSMMARSLIFLLFCLCLPREEIWISFFRNVVPYMGQFRGGRFFSYTLVSFINGLVAAPYEFSPPALIARVTSLLAFGCVATLLIYTWAVCTLLHKANDTETANACFSLLLIATVLCSPVAWSHYLVFLIFPMICLAAEAKAATGWTRIQIGILLVLNLVAINLAGSNVFPRATGLLRHLGGSAPTFGMALLYYHFVKQIRQSARTARVSPPVGLGTYI